MRDAMPNASFIGLTGTPIELSDKNTGVVFGICISVHDIRRAVEDSVMRRSVRSRAGRNGPQQRN
jgi:type I restriction enzyme, R subunit